MNKTKNQTRKPQQSATTAMMAAVGVLLWGMATPVAMADQETAPAIQEAEGLKLPGDIEKKSDATGADAVTPKFEIEETRTGGRLERVTVKRNNGIDEVYENKEIDSMFSKEANELGEVENVRRWTIGTF